MKTFEDIKREFGVYKEKMLFKTNGCFAADAWEKDDEAFSSIAAQSFYLITADDCKAYKESVHDVRRLDSLEEFNIFLEQAHPAFKRLVALWHLNETVCSYMEIEHYRKVRDSFKTEAKYSYICGVHLFKEDGDRWTHEFAIFNDNESGLNTKVIEEFKEPLSTWESVIEEAHKIASWMDRDKCNEELKKHNKLYVFESYL